MTQTMTEPRISKKELANQAQKKIDQEKAEKKAAKSAPAASDTPAPAATADPTPKKSKSERKAEKLAKKTLKKAEDTIKEAKGEKVLKYIYPADVNTGDKKKEFRRKMRANDAKYKKTIAAFMDKDPENKLPALEKEYEAFLKTYYTN